MDCLMHIVGVEFGLYREQKILFWRNECKRVIIAK